MISETTLTSVPPEISETIGTLQNEIAALRRELGQALEVWQTTLGSEKSRFEELLEHKELAWREQENQWARQIHAYEERVETLKTDFETRLKQTEQNAAHALSELDDAWQREKLEWKPLPANPWPDERHALEEKVKSLEAQLADVERLRTEERSRLEAQIQEMEDRSKIGAGPTPTTVMALRGQLLDFQQTVASFQDRTAQSDEMMGACIQALDYQIAVLHDLVNHYAPGPDRVGPPSDLVEP